MAPDIARGPGEGVGRPNFHWMGTTALRWEVEIMVERMGVRKVDTRDGATKISI